MKKHMKLSTVEKMLERKRAALKDMEHDIKLLHHEGFKRVYSNAIFLLNSLINDLEKTRQERLNEKK